MTIRRISTFGIRALLGFALLGLSSVPTSAQTTTITFNDAAAGNNSDIPRDYGSFISGNSTGFVTSGGATPNIGLTWLGNIANEWEYHTADTWVHETPVHVAQLDHNRDSPHDDNADVLFSPIDGRSVTINSFRLSGATNMGGTATYDWEVLGTAFSGTHSISPGNNTGIVNVGFTGLPGDSHTLRFTRHADGSDSAFGTALDDLSFSESLAAGAEVLRLTVNRTNGNITLKNVGSNAADIIGYSITSGAGALDASSWTTVKGNYDKNGNGSFDSNDAWTAFPQGNPGSEFTEFQFGGDGGVLAPAASLNLGNSWSQSPTEDLKLEVVLSDNRINTYTVEYVGGPAGGFEVGDLNFDGAINAADWPIYNAGRGADLSHSSLAAAYGMGDLDGDLDNDIADFVMFKTLFLAAPGGAEAWASLGVVPEPTSGLLLLSALAFIPGMRPRRGVKVSGNTFRRRQTMKSMKSRTAAILSAMLCLVFVATQAKATTITFSGSSNADIPETYGSNIANNASGFVTNDGTGATPNIGLTWFPAGTTGVNVWEFHNANTFNLTHLSPAVAQLDVDGTAQPGDTPPPDPTITFSPEAGFGVKINSLDIGQATDQNNPAYSWTINVKRSSDDATVFSHVTPLMGAGDSNPVPINFTGDLDTNYYLHFDDGGADTVRGGIDNLSFEQITVGASTMNLFVNTATGELTLENNSGSAFTIDSYEITSVSNSLDSAGWNSLQDQDFEGNGSGNIGTGNGWEEAGGVDAGQLIESYLLSDTTIANGASISLGNGFDFNKLGVQGDLTFGFHEAGANTFLTAGTVEYSSVIPVLDADFDDDNDVDGQDFLAWQRGFGASGASNAQGDANGDGNVNAQDLVAWQALYGASAATSAVTAVPEPSTVSLIGLALFGMLFLLGRQGRSFQNKGYGEFAMIRYSSSQVGASSRVGRVMAVAMLFLVTAPAMADKTTDRQYNFGDGGSSTTLDSQFVNSNDRQNLTVGNSPSYVNVNSGQFARPGTSSGDKGARFDGNNDHLWGDPLNRPDETAGPGFTGIGPILFPYPFNYDTITARGMQMWVYPEASAIGNGRQGIVFDTIAAGGVSITADGKWTQVNDSVVTDGVIEATVPVVGDQWYHVMHHVFPSAHAGAPKPASGFLFEKGFTSVVYVDGIAVSANNGNPAPNELDNAPGDDARVGVLAIGAEELPGDGFAPVFGNYFKGTVDNLEMYVFGDNSSQTGSPAGQDYGTFALLSDNDWIADQIAAIPGGTLDVGDINRNGSIDSGDVSALVNGWGKEKRLKGSSIEVNVGDWETWGWGDLNTDGLVDLHDAILLNDALLAAGQGALNFDLLLTGVPEPTSLLLALLGGTTFCLGRRRRA